MRAFITGITGFIGSHVAELLIQDGWDVLGTGFRGWRADSPKQVAASVELLHWDIRQSADLELVQSVDEFGPDAVFHFAAISIPSKCGTDKPTENAIAVNVNGTAHLLDLVQELSVVPRVVFSSTCHVYGRVERDNAIVGESATIAPVSAYGRTKLLCEQEILRRVTDGSIQATIARGFHHIGPRQPSGLMLTDWLEQLQSPDATEVRVRSTNSFLDLVDVRDAARAYQLLSTKGCIGEVYNLGSGRISNSGEVLRDILSTLGRDVTVVAQSNEERWNTISDTTKLKALGWHSEIPYLQSVKDMLALVAG